MSKKSGEHGKLTIPSDWNEAEDGFLLVAMCIPNSFQWRGIMAGQISDLAYGRKWNRNTGTIIDVQEIARDIFETMAATCLDDILFAINCICTGTTTLADKSEQEGQAAEGQLSDGVIATGPGEQFPTQEAYFDAKCNVANGIFDTIVGIIDWLKDNDVDLLAGVFGGVTSGLLVGILLSGPVGWTWAIVGSVMVSMAGFLVRYGLSFEDISDALNDTHEECVLSLFNSTNSLTAESTFIDALEAGSPTITTLESTFIRILLTSELLNQLFSPREDVAVYESADPIDCGGALLASWTFPVDEEGWTFRDDSTSPSTASGVYNGPDEALEITMVAAGGGSQPRTKGTWLKTGLSISVPAGGSCQFDYSAPSDERNQAQHLKVIYSDVTEDLVEIFSTTTAGTIVLTFPAAKTLAEIECSISRADILSNTHTSDVLEVRVFGV